MHRMIVCVFPALLFGAAMAGEQPEDVQDDTERERSARIGALADYDVDRDQRISRDEARRDRNFVPYFAALDDDGDGFVDADEFRRNREQVQVQQPRVDNGAQSGQTGDDNVEVTRDVAGFDAYDVDGDGRVSPDEASEVRENDTPQDMSLHDDDGDGRIGMDEAAGDERLRREFETLDLNNDDYLDANEVRYDPAERRSSGGNNFRSIDVNQDGYLAASEAANDSYVDAHFEDWDINDDGVLDDGELDNDWAEWDHDAFDTIDANRDGAIDGDEAAESGYVNYNFDRWDMNRDGTLTREETNTGWMGDDEETFDDAGQQTDFPSEPY